MVVHGLLDQAYPVGTALQTQACGTGRHAVYLASLGHQVTGIDRTPEMLEVASCETCLAPVSRSPISPSDSTGGPERW